MSHCSTQQTQQSQDTPLPLADHLLHCVDSFFLVCCVQNYCGSTPWMPCSRGHTGLGMRTRYRALLCQDYRSLKEYTCVLAASAYSSSSAGCGIWPQSHAPGGRLGVARSWTGACLKNNNVLSPGKSVKGRLRAVASGGRGQRMRLTETGPEVSQLALLDQALNWRMPWRMYFASAMCYAQRRRQRSLRCGSPARLRGGSSAARWLDFEFLPASQTLAQASTPLGQNSRGLHPPATPAGVTRGRRSEPAVGFNAGIKAPP